ncbi:hypothetical protein E3P77_01820 [Wallemia ichthyophaga]|nr:hypothetical protein E3P91_02102 [Wallemia ichthyophaga]TIA81909.1 hypothetical protein E3P98_01771 [Wallemia ichthyophaga]TIB13575.1 hypothetical protein E3P93_01906 [Wallemia ichthyophaga]TIB34302.1 hypothetical protein E3P84_01830 [Wallemia ichthyophaga]TIB41616.1 hypothetical protein E3P83_01781 [Wallemia ichthyophaga]
MTKQKFYCDYCDVFLTHNSAAVRKAHNSGRNHLINVKDYYASLGHDKAQFIIDEICRIHESGLARPPPALNKFHGPAGLSAPPMMRPPMPGPPPPPGVRPAFPMRPPFRPPPPPSFRPPPPPRPILMNTDQIDNILRWLGSDDKQTLKLNPLLFLHKNIFFLPPNLLNYFHSVTTPKQRTNIPIIKKRRLNWAKSQQQQSKDTFTTQAGRFRDPSNFEETVQRDSLGNHPSFKYAHDAGLNESQWLSNNSMMSKHAKLGKLAGLLSEYESERDSRSYTQSKIAALRKNNSGSLGRSVFDGDDGHVDHLGELTGKESFERLLLENWIDGVDDLLDYSVDFDDSYDSLSLNNPTELDEDLQQSKYFDDSDSDCN